MKTVRLVTFLIVAMLVLSAWTPTPVFAKADTGTVAIAPNGVSVSVDAATTVKLVKVTVVNKTGGVLWISMSGQRSYFFTAPEGKSTFQIESGRYTYVIRASACYGTITKKGNFKSGGSLGRWACG